MVLNFDYSIQLSIIHISKYCLMTVTFYLSVVVLQDGGILVLARFQRNTDIPLLIYDISDTENGFSLGPGKHMNASGG